MLKFIWGKGNQPTAERLKIQQQLFGFSKVIKHGFPHKPTSMGYDPKLKLLAIGTKQGLLRVYGRPGVELYGSHEDEVAVTQVLFLPGLGRLVTLTENNSLHLWETQGTQLVRLKSTHLDGRLKQFTQLCLDSDKRVVHLGTEGGNIYRLNLWTFEIDEAIVYQDIVVQSAPNDFKVNPGAVEGLLLHPTDPELLLIGYARGLIVLWNTSGSGTAVKTFVANQQLEGLSWRGDSEFISIHNDGSYILWSQDSSECVEPPNNPYGPYPCKAFTKVVAFKAKDDENEEEDINWMLFTGGMARASYGDKHTVTLMKGEEKHTVFDLTSKVQDFAVILRENGSPQSLLILCEEELVTIDLTDDKWPVHPLPYLNAIHASSITCVTHVADVDNIVMSKIVGEGAAARDPSKTSSEAWPVDGGSLGDDDTVNTENRDMSKDLLITGHEDGTVKFWACSGVALTPLATLTTKQFFQGNDLDEPCQEEEDEDEWPPFKKVGCFDPYSDDPSMAVRKVTLCPQSGRLFVGGTAGQVLLFELDNEDSDSDAVPLPEVVKADLVTEKEGFTWKGHPPLKWQTGEVKPGGVWRPASLIQVSPPASVNSIGFSTEWGLMAVGTAHGLVIFDTLQGVAVTAKCTLNAQDIANSDDNPMSRRKSLKKSLRESFRRLRKGRSQRNLDKKKTTTTAPSANEPIKRDIRSESPENRPLERAVEARTGSEDGLGSMVRCLHFAHTFIANPQTISATLWAGTNSGQILVFLINIAEDGEKRKTEKASAMLAKEIQLRHKAPVISIQVLDAGGVPIPEPQGGNNCPGVETTQPHRVVIASEEQFKMFMLPTLKPCGKYKLTAHEGSRVRKVGFVTFPSKADPAYSENCFTCLTNQGDLAIHSLPDLRRQVVQPSCIKKEDVVGIASLVFTPEGQAFFQASMSELQRVSVAAANVLLPQGTVSVPDGLRYKLEGAVKKDDLIKAPEAPAAAATAAAAAPTADTTPAPSGGGANKNPETAETGDTDSVVARQNQLNERQVQDASSNPSEAVAAGSKPASKDIHNDTTVSDISADITMDSVKDHTISHKPPEVVVTDVAATESSTGNAADAGQSSTGVSNSGDEM